MDFNNTLAYARTRRISQFGACIADGKQLEVELDRSGSGFIGMCASWTMWSTVCATLSWCHPPPALDLHPTRKFPRLRSTLYYLSPWIKTSKRNQVMWTRFFLSGILEFSAPTHSSLLYRFGDQQMTVDRTTSRSRPCYPAMAILKNGSAVHHIALEVQCL